MIGLVFFVVTLFQQPTRPLPRPPQPTIAEQKSTYTDKQKAAGDQKKPNQPTTIGEPVPAPHSANQNSQTVERPNAESAVRVTSLPHVTVERDVPTLIISIVLAGIGIAGIVIAICTLKKIRKQTEATQASAEASQRNIELQSIQWVALTNWRGQLLEPYILSIKVDVVNETSFPLTLEGTDFRVGTNISAGTENVTIVPRASHSVNFVHRMLEEEYTAYLSGITVFGVRGAIRFKGVSGRQVQPFGGLVTASHGHGISFESRSEYEQSAKDHYGEKGSPN